MINTKILFVIITSFFISFSIFYGIMIWSTSHHDSTSQWVDYLKQNPSMMESKKIIILGSSNIASLNPVFIENELEKNGEKFSVYNLAIGSDFPSRRINTIDQIISLNPDFIAYGIEPRMFDNSQISTSSKIPEIPFVEAKNFFPNIDKIFSKNLHFLIVHDFFSNIPKSPKLVTLLTAKQIIYSDNQLNTNITKSRPFYNIENEKIKVKLQNEQEILWKNENHVFNGIGKIDENFEYQSLLEIEEKIQKHGIKTLVFATPKNDVYINWIPNEELKNFELIFDDLENRGFSIHSDYQKYHNLEIFYDPTHIVESKEGIVYSNDFAKIILDTLDSQN